MGSRVWWCACVLVVLAGCGCTSERSLAVEPEREIEPDEQAPGMAPIGAAQREEAPILQCPPPPPCICDTPDPVALPARPVDRPRPQSGSVMGNALAARQDTPQPAGYVVSEGDSLWDIAIETMGDGTRWEELYEVNRNVIGDDPLRLRIGMRLRIPDGA